MKNLILYFKQFKKIVGNKIYYLFASMLIVGIVEGIGVTLFLPILQNGFGQDRLSQVLKTTFSCFNLVFSFKLLLVLIVTFFVLRAVLIIFYERYFGRIISNLMVQLRQRILNKIFAVDYLFILKKEVGYLNNFIIREIACVIDAFRNFADISKCVMFSLMYITLSLLLNFKVTAIAICAGPVIFIFLKRINLMISDISRKTTLSHGKYHSLLIQSLSKLKYLKATESQPKISDIAGKESGNLGNLRFQMFFLQALARNLFEPVLVFAVAALLFYYVIVLKRSINEVMFLVFLFIQISRQFLDAQASYRKFLTSIGSIETFHKFEAELELNKEDLNPGGAAPDFEKELLFMDVTIIFPSGKKALDKVNINVKPKSIVAFVGHSGSGKSTVANIITGIIKPSTGRVSMGVTDYREIDMRALREGIGYVTQEDIIFSASIEDNISLWNGGADESRLRKAIEVAHITRFVNDLPDKQNTMLGDNGLDISGGQRQRITIARELYKDAKLLILDEATSSLDSKSEKQIYENLKEFKGQKTLVVIAHRLSTIKNADYIYVLEDGRVVEEGTYSDLYEKKGQFQGMIEEQKLV
ncbi:MAG: ABC transporter ATP-binding protein/permease [Candidatus Omnitrophica bacterium]|nr:ABC transporter ATP-binding protein/permease [Candidatus Omnitrophota bacterium]MBU4488963.1 ABC transporter ATP-binding protein/permease [Candidatus Omnitrophota bacterium]